MKTKQIYLFHKLYRIVQVIVWLQVTELPLIRSSQSQSSSSCNQKDKYYMKTRAIIGVGDRKREPLSL